MKETPKINRLFFPKYVSEYLTRLDVFSNDGDMVITVRSCMFVPKTYHMTQLMDNYTKFITVLANRYSLRTISPSTHIRTAPVIKTQTQMKAFMHISINSIGNSVKIWENIIEKYQQNNTLCNFCSLTKSRSSARTTYYSEYPIRTHECLWGFFSFKVFLKDANYAQ